MRGHGLAILALAALAAAGILVWRAANQGANAGELGLNALAPFADGAAISSAAAWREQRAPALRAAFQGEIYGQMPVLGAARVEARESIEVPALRGAARVEQWRIELGDDGQHFQMLVLTPPEATAPLPVIVMQTFCGNRAFLPGQPAGLAASATPSECNSAMMQPLVHLILGRHISAPPIAEIMARGYALATFYPGDVVADDAAAAALTLESIGGTPRAGALAAWAALYSRAYDLLAADARFDARRIAIWGHSRHGKAALLAGAFDHRFAAVISHQSGRFGASPLAAGAGERRDQILKNYSYWFTPALTETSPLSIDQHQLIALNAPIPVLLGNGAGDGWSDPAGSWEALRGAHSAYVLMGSRGLLQEARGRADFAGDLVFFQRGGGHGITPADWRAFMAFLDAHLQPR
jgi:hypothetical protein